MVDMTGKVCVVTGANTGIGLETARGLAEMNASVVLACRDTERGQAAVADIKSLSQNSKVELMVLDLASQESIRGFAGAIQEKFDRLDVLVNNAATVPTRRGLTPKKHA